MLKHVSSFFILLLFLAVTAFASERVQWGSVTSRFVQHPVGYCALLPPSYDAHPARRFPVLYFLHGLGGDHTFLVSNGGWGLIEDAWEQKRLGEFVIITPQADVAFYINARNGIPKYEDFFIHDFVPTMEKKFRIDASRSGRAVGGVSMGGYGALRFAFKYPQMFVSVGVHMPALLEQLPRGSQSVGFNMFFGTAFGSPLDESYWKANTPFVFARRGSLRGLNIYVDCGHQDNYGFDPGPPPPHNFLAHPPLPHVAP